MLLILALAQVLLCTQTNIQVQDLWMALVSCCLLLKYGTDCIRCLLQPRQQQFPFFFGSCVCSRGMHLGRSAAEAHARTAMG